MMRRIRPTFVLLPLLLSLAAATASGVEVAGTLVDDAGRPVAGAAIGLNRVGLDEINVRTETGPDGRFRLSDLKPGTYLLRIDRPGAAAYYLPGIEIDRTSDLRRLILPSGASVAGRILDPAGHPLAGVPLWIQVREFLRLRWNERPDTVTSADGRFALRGLPPGAPFALDACRDGLGSSVWEMAAPPAEPVDLVLQPVGRITGRVIGPDGAPVAGVWLEPADSEEKEATGRERHRCPTGLGVASDAEGRFAVEGVRPGVYTLHVNVGDAPGIEGVEVQAGQDAGNLEVKLSVKDLAALTEQKKDTRRQVEAYIVHGRVLDWHGKPVQGAAIQCWPAAKTVRSAEDGSFSLEITAEECRLFVQAEGHADRSVPVPSSPAAGTDIRLAPEVTVTGKILGVARQDLPWVLVYSDEHLTSAVAADGTYRLTHLSPGRRTITVRAGGREVTRDLTIRPGRRKVRLNVSLR